MTFSRWSSITMYVYNLANTSDHASGTDRSFFCNLILGNGQRITGVGLSRPSIVLGDLQYKLVMAKDALKANGTFPRTTTYIDECQYPEALDPFVVKGSIVICIFSTCFLDETSTLPTLTQA